MPSGSASAPDHAAGHDADGPVGRRPEPDAARAQRRPPVLPSNAPYLCRGRTGHAFLLLHGLGGGPYETRLLADRLHARGHSVRGILYPGHEPARVMPASRWQDWYVRSRAACRELRDEHRRVHLVGFSTGCPVAIHLAAQEGANGLIMLSPFLAIRRFLGLRPERMLGLLPGLTSVRRLGPPIRDRQMRRAVVAALGRGRTFNLHAVRSALELIALVREELDQVTTPALIIQSRRDSVVEPAGALELYERLGSADKRLVWLSRSDHAIGLDVEREEVFTAVEDFVQGREP